MLVGRETRQQRRDNEFRKAKHFAKNMVDPTLSKLQKPARKVRRKASFKFAKKALGEEHQRRKGSVDIKDVEAAPKVVSTGSCSVFKEAPAMRLPRPKQQAANKK